MSPRGGARPGAGQPPVAGAPQDERINLRLTEAERAEIEGAVPAGEPVGRWIVAAALMRARELSKPYGGIMTFRQLHEFMAAFVAANPSDPALDRQVVVRVGVPDDDDDEIRMGGLQSAAIDAGCTDEHVLLLDADQDGYE